MKDKIIEVFSVLYQRHYKEKYKLAKNDNIEKFITEMRDKGIALGDDFIMSYLLFQYEYYHGMEESNQKIRLQWLISSKAIKKYVERDTKFDWCMGKKVMTALKVGKHNLLTKRVVLKKEDFLRLDFVEEILKENNPFPNSIRGLIYCIERTTMYHHKSDICNKCKLSDLCKVEQSEEKKLIHLYRSKEWKK